MWLIAGRDVLNFFAKSRSTNFLSKSNKENKLIKGCIIIEAILNAKIIWISSLINAEVYETKWNTTTTKYGVIEEGKEIGDVVIEEGKEVGDDELAVVIEEGKEIINKVAGKE